jgi:hypothetical protein
MYTKGFFLIINKNFDRNKIQELHGKEHKFFYRDLDLDLNKISKVLHFQYERIKKAEMRGVLPVDFDHPDREIFMESNSFSTIKSREYNAFQMYYPFIHDIYSSVVDMTIEACKYYNIDYNAQKYYCQAWFNINNKNNGGKLNWHDHVTENELDSTTFHGYYSINAEPSETHYMVDGEVKINKNINNRVIMSRVGYQHAMQDWDWEGPRITMAFDVTPLEGIRQDLFHLSKMKEHETFWEQHYFPLPQLKNI